VAAALVMMMTTTTTMMMMMMIDTQESGAVHHNIGLLLLYDICRAEVQNMADLCRIIVKEFSPKMLQLYII